MCDYEGCGRENYVDKNGKEWNYCIFHLPKGDVPEEVKKRLDKGRQKELEKFLALRDNNKYDIINEFTENLSFDIQETRGAIEVGEKRKYDFKGFWFHNADFSESKFEVNVDFRKTIFSGDTNFENVEFLGEASFRKAIFSGRSNFKAAIFHGGSDFILAMFLSRLDIVQAKFLSSVSFMSAHFLSESDFTLTEFDSEVSFTYSHFMSMMVFDRASFSGDVEFKEAIIDGTLLFQDAIFHRNASFEKIYYNKYGIIYFKDINIENKLSLKNRPLSGRGAIIVLKNSKVTGETGEIIV